MKFICCIYVGIVVKHGLCRWWWISYWSWGCLLDWLVVIVGFQLLLVYMISFVCAMFFSQEDGSQPDRDQVWLFLSWLNGFSLIWDHHISNFVCFAPQDLKPRFHVSRFHGSDEVEDDVCCTYSIDCLF